MSKKITGTLVWREKRYHAFVRTKSEKHYVDLETEDLGVAEKRQADYVRKFLVALGKRPTKKYKVVMPGIVMNDIAKAYYETRKADGIRTYKDEKARWDLHTQSIGNFQPKSVTPDDVEQLLMDLKQKGYSA